MGENTPCLFAKKASVQGWKNYPQTQPLPHANSMQSTSPHLHCMQAAGVCSRQHVPLIGCAGYLLGWEVEGNRFDHQPASERGHGALRLLKA